MSGLQYSSYAGAGTWLRDNFGYNQAVRVENRIEIAGQGGWVFEVESEAQVPLNFPESLDEEIKQAFKNVETTLKDAGGKGFSQVYRLTSYHVNLSDDVLQTMAKYVAQYLPHKPIWTVAGLDKLALGPMRVELEVVAYDPEGASSQ